MNRIFPILFMLMIMLDGMFAQVPHSKEARDYRAALDIRGRITEISVSPDGHIWLSTATGNLYYANDIDTDWHSSETDTRKNKEDDALRLNSPNFDRVTFFNTDTAILTGYIAYDPTSYHLKSGYYRTSDGGRTWKLLNFGKDGWIYTVAVDQCGHAWLGTGDKTILYSNDFGLHFKTLKIPHLRSDRIYAIHMTDSLSGIIGSDDNEILITNNNWKTAKNIPAPFTQKKMSKPKHGFVDLRVDKVLVWGDYLLARQQNRVFYTHKDKIEWQSFPVRLLDFALDEDHNLLMGYDDSLRLLVFSSPTQYQLLTEERIPTYPVDIKMVNGTMYMYLIDCRLCKANHDGLKYCTPLTTDYPIKEPRLVQKGKKLQWGAEGTHLYIAEKRHHWYREAELDFPIANLHLLGDSVAILWDTKQNHRYSLLSHSAEPYSLKNPLSDFLATPIRSMTITSGSNGCFHSFSQSITFTVSTDSILTASLIQQNNGYKGEKDSAIELSVSLPQLVRILESINDNPDKIPEIKDFDITEADAQRYRKMLADQRKSKDFSFDMVVLDDGGFYDSVPCLLQSVEREEMYQALTMGEGITSTTSYWFNITFVNDNKETCTMSSSYYLTGNPWFLPWLVCCNGLYFNCFDIELSRFIEECLPEDFSGRKAFDNAVLIKKIGDYYWRKKHN